MADMKLPAGYQLQTPDTSLQLPKGYVLQATPEEAPPSQDSALMRFGRNWLQGLNPLPMLQRYLWDLPVETQAEVGKRVQSGDYMGAVNAAAAGAPFLGLYWDVLRGQAAQAQQAKQSYQVADYPAAFGHALATPLPVVGPMAAQAGEQIESGDVAGGLGTTAAIFTPYAKDIPLRRTATAVAPYAAGARAAAPALVRNLPVVGKVYTAAEKAAEAYQTARQAVAERAAAQQPTTPVSETVSAVNPNFPAPAPTAGATVSETVSAVNPRFRAVAPAAEPATSSSALPREADPEFLNQVALGQTGKPYARLTAAQQVNVRQLASRVAEDEARAAASAVSPGVPAPAAAPLVVPPAPAVSPTPAATAPATPALPAVRAPEPTPQTAVTPAAAETPSPSQVSVPEPIPPRPRTTEHVPEGHVEYYPGGTPAHIPTPGELGHGRYVPEGTEMDSSTLSHIRAENEKAFNAADYAYRQGIRDPSVFDSMSEQQKRDFMNGRWSGKGAKATLEEPGALQHGREAGNPTPQTRYQANRETGSILDGNTLRLAKAHLQKLVDEGAEAGEPAAIPAPGQQALERAAETVEGMRRKQRAP